MSREQVPTSDEYKEFESIQAHDASFALYRQLGLLAREGLPAGATCGQPRGGVCAGGLVCECPGSGPLRRIMFASTPCVCSAAAREQA